MILFLILVFCYTVLVHRPLGRTLALRRERTEGAVEMAHATNAVAEAKMQEYEARLHTARLEINQAREKQIAGWNAARDQAIAEAREAAGNQVRGARAALDADARQSRGAMDDQINALAAQIVSVVLPAAGSRQAGSPSSEQERSREQPLASSGQGARS